MVLPNLIHYYDLFGGGGGAAAATASGGVYADETETNPDAVDVDDTFRIKRGGVLDGIPQRSFLVHIVLAIVFDATVRTLEPSLKSILSLTVPSTLQNRSLGFMSTLGGIGSMGGNIIGTWLFQISNTWYSTTPATTTTSKHGDTPRLLLLLGNGALPFAVVSFCLILASLFLWLLEWEEGWHRHHRRQQYPKEGSNQLDEACCEENSVTRDLEHDGGLLYPLIQRETSYEMKLD